MEENSSEARPRAKVDLERHLRAVFYAFISFALALLGYFVFGLGRAQAIGYCAAAFVTLVLLNRHSMLGRVCPDEAVTEEKG